MKNRIVKFVGIGKIKIFEEQIRPLEKDEVLVSIKSVGICGSDIHYFLEGGLGSFKLPFPMEVGHEPAGVVETSQTPLFKKGDRVAIEPAKVCMSCSWCLKGRYNLCENGLFMAANSQGSIADYVIVHKSQLVKIPKTMSFNQGALLEPLGVGLHAVHLIKPKKNASVTIFGSGPIGLCLMSILQKKGLSEIYMVDKLPYRVQFAKKMGATKSFLYDDAVQDIKKITRNKGTAYVFDAAGNNESIDGCTNVVSIGGTIGLIGIPIADYVTYNPHKLRTKEVTIQNVRRSSNTLHKCVTLYKSDHFIEKIVTHEFPLDKAQEAFDLVSTYGDNVIKCVIKNK